MSLTNHTWEWGSVSKQPWHHQTIATDAKKKIIAGGNKSGVNSKQMAMMKILTCNRTCSNSVEAMKLHSWVTQHHFYQQKLMHCLLTAAADAKHNSACRKSFEGVNMSFWKKPCPPSCSSPMTIGLIGAAKARKNETKTNRFILKLHFCLFVMWDKWCIQPTTLLAH